MSKTLSKVACLPPKLRSSTALVQQLYTNELAAFWPMDLQHWRIAHPVQRAAHVLSTDRRH
jgi:hypothetical protein